MELSFGSSVSLGDTVVVTAGSSGFSASPPARTALATPVDPARGGTEDQNRTSLVVAIKVPTGVAVAGDSRTTFASSIAFDSERKVFRVPGAPILVGLNGEVRRGPCHGIQVIREVFSSGAQSAEGVACLVERELARLGVLRASVVVAGCTPDPAVWSVSARDDGRWRAEEQLAGACGDDYVHERYVVSGSGSKAHVLLPGVHLVASLAKRWLMGTYQGGVKPGHLQAYLDEFSFRFNRRRSRARGMLFYRLLEQSVDAEPRTYRSLVASPGVARKTMPVPPPDRRVRCDSPAGPPLDRPWRK